MVNKEYTLKVYYMATCYISNSDNGDTLLFVHKTFSMHSYGKYNL